MTERKNTDSDMIAIAFVQKQFVSILEADWLTSCSTVSMGTGLLVCVLWLTQSECSRSTKCRPSCVCLVFRGLPQNSPLTLTSTHQPSLHSLLHNNFPHSLSMLFIHSLSKVNIRV